MPYGECVSRAGCLFSVSKRADEIPNHIQHLVPVSGPLLPSLTANCFVAEEVRKCRCFAGWHIPETWSLLRSALSGWAWLGQSSQMIYSEGFSRLHPLFILSLHSRVDFGNWLIGRNGHCLAFTLKHNFPHVSGHLFALILSSKINILPDQPALCTSPLSNATCQVIVIVDQPKQWIGSQLASWVF